MARAGDATPTVDAIRAAIARSLPLLEAGAKGSMEHRPDCFTCHNQGLAVFALAAARPRGFTIDGPHLGEQLQFAADFLGQNKERYLEGKGQGGAADTAGYALWTLERGGWKPDETTAAVAEYLLLHQKDRDHWESSSRRPPSEQSAFTTTFLALRGLKAFGTPEQKERIARRTAEARQWLIATPARDAEDRVFRLRALREAAAPAGDIRRARADLLATQRDDGGWAQTATMTSDAYATGSALVALHEAGGLAAGDPAYRKGSSYLTAAQLDDGSWHVKSRSTPFQRYFESGYPHGKDQFISMAAAGWATTALLLSLPAQGG